MSQPVKLSDALVLDARLTGEVLQRSIAGQIEYWARLGRSVEVLELIKEKATTPLSELVATIGTPEGQRRVSEYLRTLPFPHFEAHPTEAGLLIRTEADGTRSVGRFVNRQFVVDDTVNLPPGDIEEAETEVAHP